MAIKDILKVNRKTFFAPFDWFGYRQVKETTLWIWATVRGLFFIPAEPARKETFEEAKVRLRLTEEDIKETEKDYYFYALLFLGCAIVAFIGGFILLVKFKTLSGFILALATTGIFLSQAFRNHFLYFQIHMRKLGCTYEEWKRFTLKSFGANK